MANGGFQVNGGKDRIAFTCQRYGPEVNGGAELHCRQLAERLSAFYDVTVYTTCAKDYMTWKNEYPAGEEEINGVRVKRFPVAKERNQEAFARLSQAVFHDPLHTDRQEQEWIDEQGPYCPELISALKESSKSNKKAMALAKKVVDMRIANLQKKDRSKERSFESNGKRITATDIFIQQYERLLTDDNE